MLHDFYSLIIFFKIHELKNELKLKGHHISCWYALRYTVKTMSTNGRLYYGTKPSSESILIQHHWGCVVFTESDFTLQWCHNGCSSVSNHQLHHCLLNPLFRRRSKKPSKLCVTGLCAGNSPVTGEFPAQMASDAENVSIWWRHVGKSWDVNRQKVFELTAA